MEYADLKYLNVDLPGDIRMLRDAGDFETMKSVINARIASGRLTQPMIKRLELELAMDELLVSAYPYSREQALEIMRRSVTGATMDELERWKNEDAADWIYVNSEVRFRRNFMNNLINTRRSVFDRLIDQDKKADMLKDDAFLDGVIARQMDKGELAYYFRIKASLKVDEEYYREGKKLTVHLPVPIEGAQIENVNILSTSHEPKHIAAKDYPQRTVSFEGVCEKGTEFTVEYEFVNRAKYLRPDPSMVYAAQPCFYTNEQPPHIMFKPYMRELAQSIVGDEKNPLIKARKIYDYITTVPIYSFMPPYFTVADLPGFMATRLKGDCGVFALFFITLCRIAGVPARWQSGLYTTPYEIGEHDWAQFYVAPYGWLFADCSFGSSANRKNNSLRNEFYFGNLEPFRMVAASEFQHEFDPPMRYMRYDPYDNQDGEAEYEDAPLSGMKTTTDQTIIEAKEID